MEHKMFKLIAILIGVLLSSLSFADSFTDSLRNWVLVSDNSNFTIGTTKNETVAEVHKFQKFDGFVHNNGIARVSVNLLSIDTGIEIRDERMQAMLFTTATQAVYSATLDMEKFRKLEAGDSKDFQLQGSLEMNGQSTRIPVATKITRLDSGNYQIKTVSANKIDVGKFGFSGGIEQLRAVANLKNISPIVTFEFKLEFEPSED
jgi:polyisoprenoid-binding protein YceI